ncbi:MAG: SDR family NAD(P)-dependent oxidoreductase [Candidatus Thermoplasmatota archaeon]
MPRGIAFITGASSGIGLATARAFASDGYDLILAGRRADKLDAAHREIVAAHKVNVTPIPLDVRDAGAVRMMEVAEAGLLGRVEVLVNNAGLARGTDPIQSGDQADWDEMIDTNVKGLLRITRAVLPHMVKRGRGHVINIGSTAGHWVYPGGAVYCASKHAVRAITEGLRMDVHGSGVRVTSVDPGMVTGTEFSDVRFHGDHARARKVYEGFQPLTPEDIAETILWCVKRPAHVNVQEIILTPTAQSGITMVKRD